MANRIKKRIQVKTRGISPQASIYFVTETSDRNVSNNWQQDLKNFKLIDK